MSELQRQERARRVLALSLVPFAIQLQNAVKRLDAEQSLPLSTAEIERAIEMLLARDYSDVLAQRLAMELGLCLPALSLDIDARVYT